MKMIIIILVLLAGGLIYAIAEIRKLKRKSSDTLFIQREGDRVVFKDDNGNTIGERIIIQTEK